MELRAPPRYSLLSSSPDFAFSALPIHTPDVYVDSHTARVWSALARPLGTHEKPGEHGKPTVRHFKFARTTRNLCREEANERKKTDRGKSRGEHKKSTDSLPALHRDPFQRTIPPRSFRFPWLIREHVGFHPSSFRPAFIFSAPSAYV